MNCIFCLLVMFIHVSNIALSTVNKESISYLLMLSATRSSAFVVQGFVFLSAFKLFCNDAPQKYIPYMFGKIKKIYVPYLIWNGIYYVNFVQNGYFHYSLQDFIKYCINGTLSAPFYFVVFIMQFYLLAPLWWKLYHKLSPWLMVPLSFLITAYGSPWFEKIYSMLFHQPCLYLDRFFASYLLYWTLGAYTAKYRDKILPFLDKNRLFVTAIFVLLASWNIWLFYDFTRYGNLATYINQVLICYCVSAIYFFLCICQKIPLVKPIRTMAKMTFPIYLSHCFILFHVDKFGARFDFTTVRGAYLYRFLALYFVTFGLNFLLLEINTKMRAKKKSSTAK